MTTGAKIGAAFAVGMMIIAAMGGNAYVSTRRLLEANRRVTHTHEVIEGLEQVQSLLKDAETGQRGFVLTGKDRYLEPYDAAAGRVQENIDALLELTRVHPDQQEGLRQVRELADAKLAELRETIQLRRKAGLEAALAVILSDRGKTIMDELRRVVGEMQNREQQLLDQQNAAVSASTSRTLWMITLWMPMALLVLAVAAVALMRSVGLGGPAVRPPTSGKRWGGIALRYASALIIVAVAVVLRIWLADFVGPLPPFITLYPAILLVASVGGGGPGIMATVLAALAADYCFLPPYGQFTISSASDVLALGIFTSSSLFLSVLAERFRRAQWAEAVSVVQERQLDVLSRLNEELSQQSEELSQQSEELAQQNEELQVQSEEIQAINTELTHREDLLQKLLDAARLTSSEQAVLHEICATCRAMFGPAASAVMVLERQGNRLAVCGQAGLGPEGAKIESWPTENCFAELVMAENKTACLVDVGFRPDLKLIHPPGEQAFQAVLAAPLHRHEEASGVVAIFSCQKQEWTAEQFRLAEWLAGQCSSILEALRLQEQLAESESRFRTMANAIPQLAWMAQGDGFIYWYNQRWYDYTGTSPGQMEGWGWQGVHDAEMLPKVMEQWKASIATGEPFDMTFPLRGGDGVFRPFLTRVMPLKDDAGRVQQWFGTNTDVSQQRRVEADLARLAAIVASSDDAIVSKDLRGIIQTWNAGAERLFGYRAEEVIGQPIALLLPPERIQEEEQVLSRVRSGQPVEHLETVRLTKAGRPLDVSLTVSPIRDQAGGIIGASKILHNITDRKRAEAALARERANLQAVFDVANVGMLVLDEDGAVKQVNATLSRWAGRDVSEWAGGQPGDFVRCVRALAEPGGCGHGQQCTACPIRNAFTSVLQSGQPIHDVEAEVVLSVAGGEVPLWLEVSADPLELDGKRHVILAMNNITDRKRAEEALKAAWNSAEIAKAGAEQANRAKDHFLAVLSHELRTPLTPVVMGLSMLQDRPDVDSSVRETLEMIRRNVEMEARLIDDLLDVSRIARGKIELSRSAVELSTILRRAVEVCKSDIEARRLEFGVDLGEAAPYWVEADASRLQQVFWNLLKNSIKFTPHGGCVGIRCRPDGGHVLVEVNDSGIGIEPEALERIFSAFEQAERSITRQFGGLGLGLAISKALVELHGGQIQARSAGHGKGATFCVRLPLTAVPGPAESRPSAALPQPAVRALHILLVEDHGVTAKMMRLVLAADGHRVEWAGDVATALELAGQHAFDLLVSDLGLPDGSGHDLMRQLRQRGYAFPGIALSGYGLGEDIQRSREAGFAAHLTKPASREAVIRAVASVTAQS